MTKPLRLKVRVQNNRLVKAREDLGLIQAEAARLIGVSASILSALENCRGSIGAKAVSTYNEATGEWTRTALKIASFYGLAPEYLWPDDVAAVKRNAFAIEMSAGDALRISSPEETMSARQLAAYMRDATTHLAPHEARVLSDTVMGEQSVSEAASARDLSITRVSQIRQKALQKVIRKMQLDRMLDEAREGLGQ